MKTRIKSNLNKLNIREKNNYNYSLAKCRLDPESKNYDYIQERNKQIDYTNIVCIGSGKEHNYNYIIFLGLGNFAENIYHGNLSLKAAKIKQRNMENKNKRLENYNPKSEKYKTQETSTLLNTKEVYKG